TVAGEFTFNTPGVFDFFCSIPGHKDAGMKGTLTVVDPNAGAAPVAQTSSSAPQSMAGMPGRLW
ncbi:MAG: plastocyanin/azurin family copper-binding protein, partial [Chloroflexota bacterium]